jgi:hypothetical protein
MVTYVEGGIIHFFFRRLTHPALPNSCAERKARFSIGRLIYILSMVLALINVKIHDCLIVTAIIIEIRLLLHFLENLSNDLLGDFPDLKGL